MDGFLTPAQQTTLLIVVGAALLVGLAVWLARRVRRARGAAAIRAAQAGVTTSLPGPWQALRDEAEMSNRVLTRAVYEGARRIFLDYYAGRMTPAGLTREYDAKEEFLLVVDEHGRPSRPVRDMIDSFHKTCAEQPEFSRWFREATLPEGEWAGVPVLLAARWLCHLVGLRHGTVEIFIDPPGLAGHTLVQVRGIDKFEAPGAFDIPSAGHVDGVDSAEESLAKELREELNLTLDQLEELRLLARYNSYPPERDEDAGAALSVNNEHRVLYRARLKPEAAAGIRFSDGEVAGLAVFSVAELRALARRYPERIASGLGDALEYYQDGPGG